MNKKQEQQILDYYSTADKYIRSKTHSNAHQTVFTKENDKYQWLVLEQKSQCEVEVRQTDRHGTITARDNYELTKNLPKCVGVERLCEGANIQIPFKNFFLTASMDSATDWNLVFSSAAISRRVLPSAYIPRRRCWVSVSLPKAALMRSVRSVESSSTGYSSHLPYSRPS